MKALDLAAGRTVKADLDYSIQAAKELAYNEYNEAQAEAAKVVAAKAKQAKQKAIKKTATKRKAAAPTKTGNVNKRSVVDYLDDDTLSDDEFSQLMEKQIRKG